MAVLVLIRAAGCQRSMMQVILLLVQETLPHYHQAIRKLVGRFDVNWTWVCCRSALGSTLILQSSCWT